MLIEDFKEEECGYVVVGSKGEIYLVGHDAKDQLKIGSLIDPEKYEPKKLKVSLPFHLRSPLIVMLEVTKQCNMDCKHCYIYAGEPRENEMSTEEIYSVLDDLKKMKVFHVFITGGEPFLRSDIIDILNYAADRNLFVSVVTNGTLLTEKLLSQITNRDHVGFEISYLYGLAPQLTHQQAFDLLKKKLSLVKKLGFTKLCWFCITKSNIDRMYELGNWCLRNGFWIEYREVMLIGRCKENREIALDIDDVEKNKERIDLFNDDELKEILENQFPKTAKNAFDLCFAFEYSLRACKGGRSFAYICSNGDMYPCSNCAAEELFFAGNVRESSFSDIWENSFKSIRGIEWKDFKECETCELNEYFGGTQFCKLRCPALSNVLHGDPLYCGASDYAIGIAKTVLESAQE